MKHQILEIPFAYDLKGKKKGQRNDRDYIRETSLAVRIACPDDAEAPVALVWHRRGAYDDSVRNPPRDFRLHEGRLYRPIDKETPYGEPDAQVGVDALVAAVAEGEEGCENPFRHGARKSHWDYREKLKNATELGAALIVSSSQEEEVAAKIRREAERHIFVGGKVYREASEPMYMVKTGHFMHRIGAEIVSLASIEGPKDVAVHFRADQLPEVLETIAGRFGRRELEFDAEDPASFREYVPDWIEVRDGFAHVLTYRHDQTPQLLAAAGRAVEQLGKHLAHQPIAVLVAYGELRDGLLAGEPGSTIAERGEKLSDALDPQAWEGRKLREEVDKFRIAPVSDAPALHGPKA
jgi:hypothetical protein